MSFNILDELVKDTIWNNNKGNIIDGDGGSSSNKDSIFIVNWDSNTNTSDKTYEEINNAILERKYILIPQLNASLVRSPYASDTLNLNFSAYGIDPKSGRLYQRFYTINPNNKWTASLYEYQLNSISS